MMTKETGKLGVEAIMRTNVKLYSEVEQIESLRTSSVQNKHTKQVVNTILVLSCFADG